MTKFLVVVTVSLIYPFPKDSDVHRETPLLYPVLCDSSLDLQEYQTNRYMEKDVSNKIFNAKTRQEES